MGHAIHFLQRLARVNDEHVARALFLYRSGKFLPDVLKDAALPERAERVAISLEDDVRGPFVIVGRDGAFITCLGAGMTVGSTPILTRSRFEKASERVRVVHEENERFQQRADSYSDSELKRLLYKIDRGGLRFSREDASEVASLLPLFMPELVQRAALFVDKATDLSRLVVQLKSVKHAPRKEVAKLTFMFETCLWSFANVAPFLGVDAGFAPTTNAAYGSLGALRVDIAHECFAWGSGLHAYRALWLAARSGEAGRERVKNFPAPRGCGSPLFLALTNLALDAVQAPRPESCAVSSLAHELAEGARMHRSKPWYYSARPREYGDRILTMLPTLVHAELPELYLPKAEIERLVSDVKPHFERWIHRASVGRVIRPSGMEVMFGGARPDACRCGSGRRAARCCGSARTEETFTAKPSPPGTITEDLLFRAAPACLRARLAGGTEGAYVRR